MLLVVRNLAWIACVVYSTIPLFWLMIHPQAHRWRERSRSPFRVLVPAWIVMWVGIGAITGHWRSVALYSTVWSWIPAGLLFAAGISPICDLGRISVGRNWADCRKFFRTIASSGW